MRILIPIALIAALTALVSTSYAPREHLAIFFALFASSALVLAALAWRVRARFAAQTPRGWLVFVVLTAAVLRLGALAAPVSLSDDVYRYAWDGELVLEGQNPYASRPSQVLEGAPATRQSLYAQLNSPDYHTLYPPLAQATFALGAGIARLGVLSSERAIRLLFLLADLASVVLLVRLLAMLGRSRWLALLYAWNPFVYWELIAGGHTEALLIPWLLLMVGFALRAKPYHLGLAIGLGALSKLTILAGAPVLGWYIARKHSFVAMIAAASTSIATIAAGYVLFWHPELLANHQSSFALYAETFSFNAPIYYGALHLLGYREGITDPMGHLVTPWLTLITVATVVCATLAQDGRDPRRLLAGLTAALAGYLLLSPVFHPWYLAPVLVCALLARTYAFLLLGLLVAASYLFYAPSIPKDAHASIMAAQFIPFSVVLLVEVARKALDAILRQRARDKFATIAAHLSPGERLLDIGAGEGYVGLSASEAGFEVELVDVSSRNRTHLRAATYDGRTLPFADGAFDVGILSYVLHHCHDPDQVIREAGRVCHKLVILETTYIAAWDRRLTTFLDHSANRLRGMRKEPLNFDTPAGWRPRFRAAGFEITHFEWLGKGIHKHVVFVLENRSAAGLVS
ncbi:MAG: methyltransferase domain-containing protein [Bradymonadaceae bacterium]|nr:methyltransferase domain-containing protein [Lujinxingiaceae bacterium]